ncbi:unnamed protein product [Amoebophrya sp. A120]|nr:unnamed protein product [Amoebophrya sp. A120]|eukprot:GSA120T00018003001.1
MLFLGSNCILSVHKSRPVAAVAALLARQRRPRDRFESRTIGRRTLGCSLPVSGHTSVGAQHCVIFLTKQVTVK